MMRNLTYFSTTAAALWMLSFLVLSILEIASAYDFTCNLYCYNGGECKHGHGKFGSYSGVDQEEDELPWEKVRHENGMYCVCPVGYTGLQCEIKFVVCGQDDHTCFNGSRCKKDHSGLDESYWRCECDAEHSVMTAAYAGKFCEHQATVFCHGEQIKGTSFCTNGGKCKDPGAETTKHVGCICPAGFEGPHCEYPIKGFSVSAMVNTATSNKSVGSIVGIVLGTFCAVGLVLFAKERYIDKPKRDAQRRAGHEHIFMASEMTSRRNNGRGIV